jgi:gliding motility-associated-like protein
VVRCSNDAPFSLFAQLGGNPNNGGSWSGPNGAHSGTFTPGTDPSGAYTYTVIGQAPCANATAVVNVSVVTAPNSGVSDDTLVCSNASQFSLINVLDGAPSLTGTWTAPGGSASSGNFIPGTSPAGIYTYVVNGQTPCANASSIVTISVQQMPNAGTNGSLTVCSNAASAQLFPLLGGSPAAGGTWTTPSGTAHNGTYLPGTQPGGNYTYTVSGTAPCPNGSSVVQITRVIAPRAGTDGTITVCSSNAPFSLLTVLGGNPDGNGQWKNPSGQNTTTTFTPGTSVAGTYMYVVAGTAPCANDTSYATVNVNQAPDAGINATLTVCSDGADVNLFSALGGSPMTGGTWTRPNGNPFSGIFDPGTSPAGNYTYTVAGITPCLNATAIVTVNQVQAPRAGNGGSFTRCSTDAPVDLMSLLTGQVDAGGVWTGPGPLTGSTFTPGVSAPGVYTYTVTGTPPCSNATAQVTATVNTAPDAGESSSVTVCQDVAEVDLFTVLQGSPDMNGTWADDDNTNQLSGSIFSTFGLPTGVYSFSYEVPGIGSCVAAETEVQVNLTASLNAGTNGMLNVCRTNTQVDLFAGLNGSPQAGGTWSDVNSTGAQTGQFFNASFVAAGSYEFLYQLTGSAQCATSTAVVMVNVTAEPNAGSNGQLSICSNGNSALLFNSLGGTPATGGTWTRNGNTVSGTYNPSVHDPGVFTYTVAGSGPCANAQATVTVSETQAPNAGGNTSTAVCATAAAFNMTPLLTGTPQPGTWSFGGNSHSALFVPGLDAAGAYLYTVPGTGPCPAAVSTLTISVIQPPQAGTNGSLLLCSNVLPFVLYSELDGADFGGTWTGPGGSTHSAGFVFNPGTTTPGDYIYSVPAATPCPASQATLSVFVNDAARAGGDVSVSFCSNGPAVDLFTVLPGNPDPSGSWIDSGGAAFDGTFVPGTTPPGTFTYIVPGSSPCGSDSADVTVSIDPAPNAGTSALHVACSSQPAFSMIGKLGGTPQSGGTWTGPLPATTPHDGIFFPSTSTPGTYVYTVPGTGACEPASSTLEVVVNQAAFAGTNANIALCTTSGAVDLFSLLGPNAQSGGTWVDLATGNVVSGTITPSSLGAGTHQFQYMVTGIAPCGTHSALVTVVINQSPNAGSNGLATICDTQAPFTLIGLLNGTPQNNGSWTAPGGASHNGIFIPGSDVGGVYTYTVTGAAPCSSATAQVNIIQNIAPDAGGNGVVQICDDTPPFELFDHLTGDPDEGGNWLTPAGTASSGLFVPGTSAPGTYTYIVSAQSPCVNDTSTVTVIQSNAASAGCNAAVQICSSSGSVPLISLLGCSPQPGGIWTFGVGGPVHGPIFDPSIHSSGTYVYTITGAAPCPNAVAQVQITRVIAPDAGDDGAVSACVNDPSITLFNFLGGNPTSGGAWTNLNNIGTLTNGVLNITGVQPGTYNFRYLISGQGPCPNDTSFVVVNVVNSLDAGEDATVEACDSQLLPLFTALGGSPQPGGFWVDVDDSGALVGNVFDASEVPVNTTWRFDYILPSSSFCESDTARVTVNVVDGPNAGCPGFLNTCNNGSIVQLATALGCSPDGDGSWSDPGGDPHDGEFDPTQDEAGVYTYLVPAAGACPAHSATVTVTIQEAPNAGENATHSICSNAAPIALFGLLGPDAQTGGTWQYFSQGIPHSGIYNPAVDSPGLYCYTITAQLPCANAVACVEVTEPALPNAGCNASINVCSSQTPVPMINHLGCAPQTGGTWIGPDLEPHGPFFDPATDEPGPYVYSVSGAGACPDASATLFIGVTPASNPGTSTTASTCVSSTSVNLLEVLGPQAQPGGVWTDLDGSNALVGDLFDPSSAGLGTWQFEYAFASNGPCPATSSTVTINVTTGSNAGTDSTLTVCGGDASIDLIGLVGGSPDLGGTWTDITGTGALLPEGILNAQLITPGTTAQFAYQITDIGCGVVTATLTLTVSEFPDPGSDSTLTMCINDPSIDLFAALGGNAETGGSWTAPNGQPHGSIFDPASHAAGIYTYSLQGNEFCADTSAHINVIVDQLASAGNDVSTVVCDNSAPVDLTTALSAGAQTTGTWTAPAGAEDALNGSMLDPTLLGIGNYVFNYSVTTGCGSDQALISVNVIEGLEVIDVVTVCNEQERTYTVSFTIQGGDPASYTVNGATGILSEEAPFTFTSDPIPTHQQFEIVVDDASACTSVTVTGTSPCTFEDDIFIPGAFSPNDDGINDLLIIPGIEGFAGNKVVIFNRWGNKMYEAAGYDNNMVVWDGSSLDALIQGKAPAGTYFYVIELGNDQPAFTGYIYLNR